MLQTNCKTDDFNCSVNSKKQLRHLRNQNSKQRISFLKEIKVKVCKWSHLLADKFQIYHAKRERLATGKQQDQSLRPRPRPFSSQDRSLHVDPGPGRGLPDYIPGEAGHKTTCK